MLPDLKNQENVISANLNYFQQEIRKLDQFASYKYDWAKIYLLTLEFKSDEELSHPEPPTLELTLEALNIFESKASHLLVLQVLQKLCTMTKLIDLESLLQYSKKGLSLSQQNKLIRYEKYFRMVHDKAQKDMKQKFQNKVVFLSSYPYVSEKEADQPQFCIHRDIFESLYGTLERIGKNIEVVFEVLTPDTLEQLYNKNEGCKILVLDLHHTDKDHLMMEDGAMGLTRWSHEMMNSLTGNSNLALNVDILIILNEQPEKVIGFFSNSGVKHIVHFNFKPNHVNPLEYDIFSAYWIREFKVSFVKKFIREYLKQQTALVCLNQAKIETVETMSHRIETEALLFKSSVDSYKTTSVSEKPRLHPEFSCDNIVLVTNREEELVETELEPGSVKIVYPNSCKTASLPRVFVRRDFEVWHIFTLLRRNQIVYLYGQEGAGKSFIARTLSWELAYRRVYRDGVFYFDLKEIDNPTSIRSFMSKKLGDNFYIDTQKYFENKHMLVILDSYDRVISKKLTEPKHLLDMIVQNPGVSLLLVTSTKGEENEYSFCAESEVYSIDPFTPKQSLLYLLSLSANQQVFFGFDGATAYKLTRCDTIKESNGLPARLHRKKKRFLERSLNATVADRFLLGKSNSILSPTLDSIDMTTSSIKLFDNIMSEDRSYTEQFSLTDNLNDTCKTAKPPNHDAKKDKRDVKTKLKSKKKKHMT